MITPRVRSTREGNDFTDVFPSTKGYPVPGPRSLLGRCTPVSGPMFFPGGTPVSGFRSLLLAPNLWSQVPSSGYTSLWFQVPSEGWIGRGYAWTGLGYTPLDRKGVHLDGIGVPHTQDWGIPSTG